MSKLFLIIGASSDIGVSLIKSIDEEGIILAHYYSNKTELLSISKTCKNTVVPIKCDLSSTHEVELFLDDIFNNYGCPNVIVNFAALKFQNIRFKDIEWCDYENEINLSLRSTFLIMKRFLPLMAKSKQGKVVFMLSSCVLGVPPSALSHYTTLKYAMYGLFKSLSSEYASKNIQINAVSPSMVETKFLDEINPKLIELSAYSHPLKRNALVSEIVPIFKMLISSDSDYMNGVNVPITGGSVI